MMKKLKKMTRVGGIAALIVVFLAAVYAYAVRPWHLHRGATKAEAERPLPGDDRVPNPKFTYTQAITVQAPPEEVWPWLVQIGYQRAGWYSHDWIHRLLGVAGSVDDERRSADRIIPELQDLQEGDLIEIAPGMGFEVLDVARDQFLLTGTEDGSWVWYLDPIDPETTRLIVRMRGTWGPGLGNTLLYGIPNDLGSLVMQPKTLRGIKERAEATASWRE
jgi:hypothetical protein